MTHANKLLLCGAALASSVALAQSKPDTRKVERQIESVLAAGAPADKLDAGRFEYESSCASCHGLAGKGMGPYSDSLKRSPPDLTTLAKRNGGVFPISHVYSTIDGAEASHGSREMPIWGSRYRLQTPYDYVDREYNPATYVRARILSLVDYLYRIQEK